MSALGPRTWIPDIHFRRKWSKHAGKLAELASVACAHDPADKINKFSMMGATIKYTGFIKSEQRYHVHILKEKTNYIKTDQNNSFQSVFWHVLEQNIVSGTSHCKSKLSGHEK